MNARILASVSFTIIGVIMLSRSILLLQSLASVTTFAEHYEGSVVLLALGLAIPSVLLVVFGGILITKRDALARRLVPDADLGKGGDSRFMAVVAFAVLGFYLFITTLPWVGSMTRAR